ATQKRRGSRPQSRIGSRGVGVQMTDGAARHSIDGLRISSRHRHVFRPSEDEMKRLALSIVVVALPLALQAQIPTPEDPMRSLKERHIGGSSNIHVVGHLPLGYYRTTADIEMEQELSRPYVYLPRRDALGGQPRGAQAGAAGVGSSTIVDVQQYTGASKGVDIISIKDPTKPILLYSWRIENQELHSPSGGLDNEYFKLKGRYYDAQSFQMGQSGPDADLGAVILDVTGLPDTSKVREAGRIRVPEHPGGFHD